MCGSVSDRGEAVCAQVVCIAAQGNTYVFLSVICVSSLKENMFFVFFVFFLQQQIIMGFTMSSISSPSLTHVIGASVFRNVSGSAKQTRQSFQKTSKKSETEEVFRTDG